jgi:hypothetical protein
MVRIRSCVPRLKHHWLAPSLCLPQHRTYEGASELSRKARLLLYLLAEATVYITVCFPPSLEDSSSAASESHKVHPLSTRSIHLHPQPQLSPLYTYPSPEHWTFLQLHRTFAMPQRTQTPSGKADGYESVSMICYRQNFPLLEQAHRS